MTQHDEIAEALGPLLEVFGQLGIAYRIGGSVASSALGAARSTLDVDLVANVTGAHVADLAERLKDTYYIDEGAVRQAEETRSSFNVIHLATMVKVDVFVLRSGAYDRESFHRDRLDSLGRLSEVHFCTPEDVVLRKLEWYRNGGGVSDRQWSDVLGVLRVQAGRLDWEYLNQWAGVLGVANLLDQARGEAGM